MSTPANLRGWPAGWPKGVPAADLVWVRAARSGAKWQVHRGIAPILQFIVDEVERRGYLFDHGPNDVDDDWGYSNRPIGGTEKASEHSRGIAIDFDAQEYPQHSSKRAPQWIYDLFYAYGFEIGADWGRASVDPMHVEFRGSVTEARHIVAMLAAAHVAGEAPDLPPQTPPLNSPARISPMEDNDMKRIIWIGGGAHLVETDGTTMFDEGIPNPTALGLVKIAYPGIREANLTDTQWAAMKTRYQYVAVG